MKAQQTYIVLLRGINVGGKNKVPMAELRDCLEDCGFAEVKTYIASGNIILKSEKPAAEIKTTIEKVLPTSFKLDSKLIRALVLTTQQIEIVIKTKPKGFGDKPQLYHSDVIFLMDTTPKEALAAFNPRERVDKIWPGKEVIYSQRLSAERTKSRLNKIMSTKYYQAMTIRNWNTTLKLQELSTERQ